MIRDTQQQASQEFIADLKGAVSDAYFDRMTRLLYSTDASIYQMMPVGVAIPRDADEVSAAVEIAVRHGVPVLPRGGGSSLAGQAVGHALILDLSRYLDQVLEVDTAGLQVRTQPGITLGALNQQLARYGLSFGPDPASGDRATMGGVLGNNSTGAHSILYGMTSDHVITTDVILADGSKVTFDAFDPAQWEQRGVRPGLEGEIYASVHDILTRYQEPIKTRYPHTFRHVAGYNLHALSDDRQPNLSRIIVGSEGTLGIVTEMTLDLVRIPPKKRLAIVHFSSRRAALEAVPHLMETMPAAVEVMDKMLLDLTRDRMEYRRLLTFVEGDPEMILLLEYSGEQEAEIAAGIERMQATLNRIGHRGPKVIVSDPQQQANVWFVRKVGLGILMSVRGDAKPIPFIEDSAVPVEFLADYVEGVVDAAAGVGVDQVAMYGHASAGCIHIRPLVNLKQKDGIRQMRQIAEKSVELVVGYGGTTSGEHGEGLARGEFSERLFGSDVVQAFREVKAAFDPQGLMNPGKVVDVGPMDDIAILRFGSEYAVPQALQDTVFSYASDQGFDRAIEMCNGAGVCRQLENGVMCPSFQATRDETHSTRGRANALRAAMMGLLGPDGMTSEELYAVMDLCLSCHACKNECPSSVDMAKLKAEFLHAYYREHGVPLRSRIFANIAALNKMAQPLAPLANWALRGLGKWAMRAMGVHKNRSLPAYAAQTFSAWYRKSYPGQNSRIQNPSRQVVFFHDTFMEHNHPEIGKAAIQILKAAGYAPIILFDRKCCGRPAVSKGLLDEAKAKAEHNVALLAPYAREGIAIIGVEPSCTAMLVDEYLDLVPGDASRMVAQRTFLFEQFLVREAQAGNLKLDLDDAPRKVLFHGHCQQKAIFGVECTMDMLRLIPNCDVELIESGCCGMAGSFGYEKEHYDLSIQLAEMSLAPSVRAAAPEAIICATGTSCRDQIVHTTGRKAIHPIQVLASALAADV